MRDYGTKSPSVVPFKTSSGGNIETKPPGQGIENELPEAPEELGDVAREHWYKIGSRLDDAGLISSLDYSAFRVYCETYELYVEAQKTVREKGEYQKTQNDYEQLAPWSIARERHAAHLHKLEQKLFLTPYARKSIKVDVKKKTIDN